jgi:hypothetical protein
MAASICTGGVSRNRSDPQDGCHAIFPYSNISLIADNGRIRDDL